MIAAHLCRAKFPNSSGELPRIAKNLIMGGLEPPIQRRATARHKRIEGARRPLDGRVKPGHGEFLFRRDLFGFLQ
jgi:hypothetical protein